MKRIKCILVMAMMAICLVGCGKYEHLFQINADGTGSIAILYATNESQMQKAGMDPSNYDLSEIFYELKDRGFAVETYNKDGYEGYVVSAQNVDINQAMNDLYVVGSGMEFVGFGPGKFNYTRSGSDCSIDWYIYDSESDTQESFETVKQGIEATGGIARISMYLPSPAYDHDAPYVSDDGTSLQWDLLDLGSDQALHVSFSLNGAAGGGGSSSSGQQSQQYGQQSQQGNIIRIDPINIMFYLGVVAVGGTALYLFLSSRKKEKMAEMYENYNSGMNPVALGMQQPQPQQAPNLAQMSGMQQKTPFGGPQGMNGMNNPNPMGMGSGMQSGMGSTPGMQNTPWGSTTPPQQTPNMAQTLAGMAQPSATPWAQQPQQPQQPQPQAQPQMSNFQPQQMSNLQPQQVSNFSQEPTAPAPNPTNNTPDWGV